MINSSNRTWIKNKMAQHVKKLLRYLFYHLLYVVYSVLVKITVKDKKTLPERYVHDVYEIFPAPEATGTPDKIALPYVSVDNFNKHDLNRPYEVMRVSVLEPKNTKQIHMPKANDLILPIALLNNTDGEDKPSAVAISYGTQRKELQLKFKNRFHYLPIKTDIAIDRILINSPHERLGIGDPIFNRNEPFKSKPKLIVHIFVDALSKVLLDLSSEDMMPATKGFFSKGTIFENAYSQADWTLSSMSGAFTGKYTKDHLMYHPRRGGKIKPTTVAEVLSSEGYTTSSISSVPKLTPISGFDKGFARCVVAPFKDANFIVNEAIEQLDTFNGNQYLFLGFFDVHEAFRLQPISSQVKNCLSDFNYKDIQSSKGLSILYDDERIARYLNTLKHFDSKLERLYTKINDYDENATVVLHSDHGVDFMTCNTQRLSKERQKVALMIKGKSVSAAVDKTVREIREVPSMILNASDIEDKMEYEKTGFAKTESIYPNQEYELAIRNSEYVLFFQVPWKCLRDRMLLDYKFTASFHCVSNESEQIEPNKTFERMLSMAKDHYVELVRNLNEFERY